MYVFIRKIHYEICIVKLPLNLKCKEYLIGKSSELNFMSFACAFLVASHTCVCHMLFLICFPI